MDRRADNRLGSPLHVVGPQPANYIPIVSRRRKQPRDHNATSAVDQPPRPGERSQADGAPETAALVRRHLRFGWRSLLLFLTLGLVLEGLHGFKVGWYLEISGATRRHMWTLAHAHGTLLAVLNLVFASTLHLMSEGAQRQRNLISAGLLSASVLLPVGFFLGGFFTHEADPGLGIVLVPIGGALLFAVVLLCARR